MSADTVTSTTVRGTASGRIDFLGGVGDFSGSLVLQVATSCATTVEVTLSSLSGGGDLNPEDELTLLSPVFGESRVPLSALRDALDAAPGGGALSPSALRAVRAMLAEFGAAPWVFYVFGSVAAYALETGWLPPRGSRAVLSIASTVPLGQGVSSSASIEVATLRALQLARGGASGAPVSALRVAHVAQAAENYVVGAPCGLMDQLASSLGAPGRVLPILCRPDAVSPPISLPAGVCIVGWPSGVEHSLADGASPYLHARTATFMAKRVVERLLGRSLAFITEIPPSELHAVIDRVPESISGDDFVRDFGGVDDGLSKINAAATYKLRATVRFPVEENFRCVVCARARAHAPPPPPPTQSPHIPRSTTLP